LQLPPQLRPASPDFTTALAIRAWNVMGGIDWAALPIVCELFGVADPDLLIHQLVAIRDSQRESE
jgi:hypothetical protein